MTDDLNKIYELRDNNVEEISVKTGYSVRALKVLIEHSKKRGYYPPKVPVNLEAWASAQKTFGCQDFVGIGGCGFTLSCQKPEHSDMEGHIATYFDDYSDRNRQVTVSW